MRELVTLASRVIRSQVVPDGLRILRTQSGDGDGNFLGFLAQSAVIGAVELFKAIKWTFTSIWGMLIQGTSFILNFNWNVTDQEINSRIEAALVNISGLIGQAVGKTLGFLVCGALPTAAVFVISPTVGKAILADVTQELIEQLAFHYAIVIEQIGRQTLQAGALWLYGSIRRAFRGSDEEFKNKLKQSGANEEAIKKAIEERNKPFILSQNIQNTVDNIDNKYFKAFYDQGLQEFGVACIEAGYVVAGALDNYVSQQQVNSPEAMVELGFNEDGSYSVKALPFK